MRKSKATAEENEQEVIANTISDLENRIARKELTKGTSP